MDIFGAFQSTVVLVYLNELLTERLSHLKHMLKIRFLLFSECILTLPSAFTSSKITHTVCDMLKKKKKNSLWEFE